MNDTDILDGAENTGAVSAPTDEVVSLALHLLAVRGAVRIGIMLNELFPSEEAFTDFLNSEDTIAGLAAFAEARADIARLAIRGEEVDDERLAAAIKNHHPRALESVDLLAEQIGVPPEDLFAFLLRA